MFLEKYLDNNDISTGSDIDGVEPRNINIDGHVGYKYIQTNYPKEWKEYFKFAVERNPWDAMVSKYYWYKKIKPKKAKNSFYEFVANNKKLSSLNDWKLYADRDNIVVDKLIPYEEIHEFFSQQTIIPYNNEMLTTFVKSGIRPTKEYKDHYNKETVNLIEDEFAKQIKLLDYKFE